MNIHQPDLYSVELDPLEKGLEAIRKGGFVVLMDHPGREGEGDLVASGAHVNPAMINFMITEARGAFVAIFMPEEQAEAMELPVQVPPDLNQESQKTNFRLTCDTVHGTSGCSAADRAQTVNILAGQVNWYDEDDRTVLDTRPANPRDLVRPGHVVPIVAHNGLLGARQGHTEAGVTLMKMAGITPAVAVDMEVLEPSGRMAKQPYLRAFADRHGLPLIAIPQLLAAQNT